MSTRPGRTVAWVGAAVLVSLAGVWGADIATVDDGGTVRFGITTTGATRVVANDGTEPGLKVTQQGAGPAFRVDDAPADTTPFVTLDAQRQKLSRLETLVAGLVQTIRRNEGAGLSRAQ